MSKKEVFYVSVWFCYKTNKKYGIAADYKNGQVSVTSESFRKKWTACL